MVMKMPLLGWALWALLLHPGLTFSTTNLIQNCSGDNYEITVLMMQNSAFQESLENLKQIVYRGVEIVKKRLREAGKRRADSSLLPALGPEAGQTREDLCSIPSPWTHSTVLFFPQYLRSWRVWKPTALHSCSINLTALLCTLVR